MRLTYGYDNVLCCLVVIHLISITFRFSIRKHFIAALRAGCLSLESVIVDW